MKFKRILKRKVYPTWVSTTRTKGFKVYIFHMSSMNFYHFQIECDGDIVYISLTEGVKFSSFEECCLAAEEWIKNYIDKLQI